MSWFSWPRKPAFTPLELYLMSALTDAQASVAALATTADTVLAKIAALNQIINTTIPSDEPALVQLKSDVDAINTKLSGV